MLAKPRNALKQGIPRKSQAQKKSRSAPNLTHKRKWKARQAKIQRIQDHALMDRTNEKRERSQGQESNPIAEDNPFPFIKLKTQRAGQSHCMMLFSLTCPAHIPLWRDGFGKGVTLEAYFP